MQLRSEGKAAHYDQPRQTARNIRCVGGTSITILSGPPVCPITRLSPNEWLLIMYTFRILFGKGRSYERSMESYGDLRRFAICQPLRWTYDGRSGDRPGRAAAE